MKKSLKSLQLKKDVITNFKPNNINGASYGVTDIMCNSVPRHLGGLGCHMR